VYPGTCRMGPTHPERPAARRWIVPSGTTRVHDRICGPLEQDVAREVGDFVLRRGDGAWAYQLAVVIDDAAMGITDVLRGQDLLWSTPRQVALQRALGLSTPRYAHVPLMLDPEGNKLGKRDGAPDLIELRTSGADPQVVVADLARSCGLVSDAVTRVTPQALVADFALERVSV